MVAAKSVGGASEEGPGARALLALPPVPPRLTPSRGGKEEADPQASVELRSRCRAA